MNQSDLMKTPNLTKMNGSFSHNIKVRWADCDPANIAYTGTLANFSLEAIDAWWEKHTGSGWYEMNIEKNIGLPFVHMSIDFMHPVTPKHLLECQVKLIKLGTNSIRFEVVGFQKNTVCFTGEFVEALVDSKAHKKTPMPNDLRELLTSLLEDESDG